MARYLLAIGAAAVMLGAQTLALAQTNPAVAPINPPPVCPGPVSPLMAALLASRRPAVVAPLQVHANCNQPSI